eukprot:1158166-Pelagomonas_calceolata.AAC.6
MGNLHHRNLPAKPTLQCSSCPQRLQHLHLARQLPEAQGPTPLLEGMRPVGLHHHASPVV